VYIDVKECGGEQHTNLAINGIALLEVPPVVVVMLCPHIPRVQVENIPHDQRVTSEEVLLYSRQADVAEGGWEKGT
jgi:hypothetical protein